MKVFSLEKFTEDCRKVGDSEIKIELYVRTWAKECEGKTKIEIEKSGLSTSDDWMIEKGEEK